MKQTPFSEVFNGYGSLTQAGLDEKLLTECAAKKPDIAKIRAMMHAGASLDAADADGNTPLHLLMQEQIDEEYKTLARDMIAKGASPARPNNKSLMPGFTPRKDGGLNGNMLYFLDEERERLQNEGKLSARDLGAVLLHELSNHPGYDQGILERWEKRIEKIIAAKPDLTLRYAPGMQALHISLDKNLVAFSSLLIHAGAPVNESISGKNHSWGNATPLVMAACMKWEDGVKELLDKGAIVNVVDDSGNTPIYYAAQRNARDCALYMIAAGADVEAPNYEGKPLRDVTKSKPIIDAIDAAIEKKQREKEAALHDDAVKKGCDFSLPLEKDVISAPLPGFKKTPFIPGGTGKP